MEGVVRQLIIGGLIMTGIMLGYFSFLINSFSAYGVANNASDTYSQTMSYIATLNSTTESYQAQVTGNNTITTGASTWLGIIFNSFGTVIRNFLDLTGFYVTVTSDLTSGASKSGLVMPSWFTSIIITIIITILVLAVIALIINRRQKEI